MKSIKVKSSTCVVTPLEYLNLPVSLRKHCVIKPELTCTNIQVMFRKRDNQLFVEFLNPNYQNCLETILRLPFHKSLSFLFSKGKVRGVKLQELINAPSELYSSGYFIVDDFKVVFIVDRIEVVS